jgi:hypothetical protein
MNRLYNLSFRTITPTKEDARLRFLVLGDTAEADAASNLASLAEEGWSTLSLLRNCEGCNTKFFAARSNQKCCNENCRQKKLEATDRFKNLRSAYMRKQYWDAKSGSLLSAIKNLSQSREDQKKKAQLQERRKAAKENAKAAEQEWDQLKERKP